MANDSGGVIQLKKDDLLFRENDPSDAMFVIKKGRIKITKAKGNDHIVLAELGPGQMLGEMAFFDNRPRSAGAQAGETTEVIKLPFSALHAQFKTFPEWLKAMVKTVNSHLRDANMRIKNLESVKPEDEEVFPPHTITKLSGIISLIGFKAGRKDEETGGLEIPTYTLRNYTIQIFQQPTHKMDKLVNAFSELGYMKTEDLGEGNVKTVILNHGLITHFVDWYNKWIFSKEGDKVVVEENEMFTIHALLHYGKLNRVDGKSEVTVNLTDMQNSSMKDLERQFSATDPDSLASKGLVQEKVSGDGGVLTMTFDFDELSKIYPFWEIIYKLEKVRK